MVFFGQLGCCTKQITGLHTVPKTQTVKNASPAKTVETEYGLANVTKTATKIILKEPTTK